MKLKGKNDFSNENDDFLHQPDDTLKWRESYYFDWADISNKISGFSTIGIVPNENRSEFVFFLFFNDKREAYYREPSLKNFTDNIRIMLQEKRLSYKLIKPMKKWEINYKCPKFSFTIRFKGRFPTCYFGKDASASWHQHFETSGVISGEIKFKNNQVRKINGYGQRDKSWGYRDWHQFDRWHHANLQFKDWSCAFRKDYQKDRIDLSGNIVTKEGCNRLSEVNVEVLTNQDKYKSPLITKYQIIDVRGNRFNIKAKPIDNNTSFRFSRSFPGGYTEMFDQMVIMENIDTGEKGSGIAELLRSVKSY
jgi:hypothetical protein